MTPLHLERAARLEQIALGMLGSPYLWPCAENGWRYGSGQHLPDGRRTFDCEGFASWCVLQVNPDAKVKGVRLDPRFFNAHRLWCELDDAGESGPGVAAFYGKPEHVTHVVLCLKDGRIIGANGGGRTTTSAEEARKVGACVKMGIGPNYRRDLVGFRLLPLT